ncbi:hypothetical protein [Dongia sp.]|uniref:hypothetical protein n=1 Tax=Dongia sp. TaxID=1977262 RepID=UPI0035B41C35
MDIYETCLKRGYTHSKRDFSTYYAGKSPSYLATTRTLSEGAMLAVFRRLIEERRWLLAFRVARTILFARHHDDEVAA